MLIKKIYTMRARTVVVSISLCVPYDWYNESNTWRQWWKPKPFLCPLFKLQVNESTQSTYTHFDSTKYRVFHNFTSFWNWIYNHNFITKYVLKTNNTKIKIFDSSILDPAFLKYLYEFSFGDSITLHTGVAYYANACIQYVELEGGGGEGDCPA